MAGQRLLEIQLLDQSEVFLKKHVAYNKVHVDSLSVLAELKLILQKLHEQAYLEASIDSLNWKDTVAVASVSVGNPYEWANLRGGNVDPAVLQKVGFREKLYQGKKFHYTELAKLRESLLTFAENNGYPFATVKLNKIEIQGSQISADLILERNRRVVFDTLQVTGDVKLAKTYLENYLGIQPGELFSLEKVRKIRQRIRELNFVKEKKDATIRFQNDKAVVQLFLEKQSSSRWDFLFGLLPGGSGEERDFQLSVSLTGDLQNQFGRGEQLYFDFQRLRPETQELELRFAYPYLLGLPIGIDSKFEQFRSDSTYRDLRFDIGLQYLFEGNHSIRVFWSQFSTALLSINEDQIIQTRRLPATLDVRNTTVGLEYNRQELDYRFNPRRGWRLWVKSGVGNKKIPNNINITELKDEGDPTFDFASLYDTLDQNTFQLSLIGTAEAYIPILKRSTIKAALQSGMIFSDQDIYRNEQFRIGGNRLLRGFDEESIFVTRYGLLTLEYRFLLGGNSYFYAFGDAAYLEDVTADTRRFDRALGLGLGMTFQVKAGVFGISLAVGRQKEVPFNLRNTKTHFGYVNYF